jgi:putative aminopeptidase FrvX
VLRRALAVIAVALGVAGCTSTTGSSSSSKFTGAQGQVAKVVSDLSQAGQRKDAQKICTQILSQALVRQLSDAGTSCQAEMKKAIDDADDYDLNVQRVTVNGSQATAVVKRGSDGPTATFRFVRENGAWKATSFGG